MNESTLQNNLPTYIDPTISDITMDEEFWLKNNDTIDATVEADGSLCLLNYLMPQPSTSLQDQPKDSDSNTDLNLCQDHKTPVKKSEDTGSKYPTPFKNALFWPGNTEKKRKAITDNNGQIKKTKNVSHCSNYEFMEHQQRVEAEKLAKDKDKLDRAQKRKAKSQQTNSKGKTKHVMKTDVTGTKEKMEYPEGAFVVVQYEAEYFPGIVIKNEQFEIKNNDDERKLLEMARERRYPNL